MKKNIEHIIEEFQLSKEDLVEIDKMMHKLKSHLLYADDWEQAYATEFYGCAKDYLGRKPKHL